MPLATINAPFPNRIVLDCSPFEGPFSSAVLGSFDCTRDVRVYLNGDILTITSFTFDGNNNRYLMYTTNPFLSGVVATDSAYIVQVVGHIPNPPFEATNQVNDEPQTVPAAGSPPGVVTVAHA